MKRWHQEEHIAAREQRKHLRTHVESNLRAMQRDGYRVGLSPEEVDCPCDKQVGRFRKTDAFDCGKPRCGVCHWEKYHGKGKTRRGSVADLRFREQLEELT